MRFVYAGGGFGVGWGYEISCVLSREGDVGAGLSLYSLRLKYWILHVYVYINL